MLPLPIGEVSLADLGGGVFIENTQRGCAGEQGKIAEIAKEFWMLVRVRKDQVLDDELDIDNAATCVFEVKLLSAVFLFGAHFFAHCNDLSAELDFVACHCEYLMAYGFERPRQRRVSGAETCTRQRLMFPSLCAMQLIVAKRIEWGHQ